MEVTRRDFFRYAGLFGAAGVLAPVAAFADEGADGGVAPHDATWTKGVCRFCGTGCGVEVATAEGRVVAVRGDNANPVNRGLLCIKGYSLPEILYAPDRLTRPLIRRGEAMEEASWEEALDLVAGKIRETIERHGPEAVALYGSGQWTVFDGYVATKFWRAGLGSNNLEANARLCMASAVTGFMSTFGMDEPSGCYDDFEAADTWILWGNDMAEMHPMLWLRVLETRGRTPQGAIVDISPRRTRTTADSDRHVHFNPGSDLFLANAILKILVEEDRIDADFIARHVVMKEGKTGIGYGLDGDPAFQEEARPIDLAVLRERLAPYTVERAVEVTGASAEDVRYLAGLYGDPARRIVSLWCMGPNQHVRGTWMNNLIYDLHLLTGKIGKPGQTPLSLTGQPSACGTVREVGTLCHRLPHGVVTDPRARARAAEIWGVPVEKIPPKPGLHTVAMFRAFEKGDLKFLWSQCTNPFQTMPNLARFRKGPARDDTFLVVSDIYPTKTTQQADVVLPSAAWVERSGVFGNTERRTQYWPQMVDPPGEAKADHIQLIEVARRLGHGGLFEYPGQVLEEALWEEYRKFHEGHGHDMAPLAAYKEARGLRWPVVNGKETVRRYVEGEDPYVPAGEGIRFYGNADGKAVVWFRPYEPPAESPDAEYPFWLMTGRVLEHWHTGTMTRRVPELLDAYPRAVCEIHPDDGRRLGIQTGSPVRLTTRRGSLTVPADIEGRSIPAPGIVFISFFDESILVNDLTLDATCPISKQPDYKKCAVRVERI